MASVVHYSTKIEGNRLTRGQVESILSGEAIEAPERDKVEATNYFQAMQWARSRADDGDWQLSTESIKTLHFLIGNRLGNDYLPLGAYRQKQNHVEDLSTGVVIYEPPPVEAVAPAMEALLKRERLWRASHQDPYITNAFVHLNLAGIHPFSDGNGRVTRVLCSMLLMSGGFRTQAFYSLEEYLGEKYQEYGIELERVLGDHWAPTESDATTWIEWYLKAIAEQVDRAANDLERSKAELIVLLELTKSGVGISDIRQVIGLWVAVRERTVTNRQYRSLTGVSARTATTDLASLAAQAWLERQGEGKSLHYRCGQRFNTFPPISELVETYRIDGRDGLTALLSRQDSLF